MIQDEKPRNLPKDLDTGAGENPPLQDPYRRDFLQTTGLIGAGVLLSESLLRAEVAPNFTAYADYPACPFACHLLGGWQALFPRKTSPFR